MHISRHFPVSCHFLRGRRANKSALLLLATPYGLLLHCSGHRVRVDNYFVYASAITIMKAAGWQVPDVCLTTGASEGAKRHWSGG
eukprot:scaffold85699_cov33-Tisochrysis_lutea.AAC.2